MPEPARARRSGRPTAADVARKVGLSRTTVSYVLNDTPHQNIPTSTRERVHAAAAELGYLPSAAARMLSSGRSDVVLLLMPDWPIGANMAEMLERLSVALADHGYTFVTHPQVGRPVEDVWKSISPAAVISFQQLGDIETTRLRGAGIELAAALFGDGGTLDVPEEQTGRFQADYLLDKGHERLGYAWPDDQRVVVFAEPRLEGVRQACRERGVPDPVVHTVSAGITGAVDAVRSWRDPEVDVTGVCAYNDDVALTVLAGARLRGVEVPEQLSVIGVDNTLASAVSFPSLTTVRFFLDHLSPHIADYIVCRIEGRPLPERPESDLHTLIARDSA